MKRMIIAALSTMLMGFAAMNSASAQDYQRQTTREYQTNGYGGQHRTTITTTTSRERYHHHPMNGYYREGTWYGYRKYHRPYRVHEHDRYYNNSYDRRNNSNIDINIRDHRDLDRRNE